MPRPCRWPAAFLLCYVAYLVILALYAFRPGAQTALQVCLVGNAPDEDAAERVYKMWDQRFPGAYYLWNTTRPRKTKISGALVFIAKGVHRKTFAEGIEEALAVARFLVPVCDYYFTHDDDLFFSAGTPHHHISDVLIHVLQTYRPLVASFPWDAGIRMHHNLAEIHEHWRGSEVGPMVGFDNGMILYHSSVVDLFIPFAPRGEGGFVGHWTLGAHFIDLVVTMALRPYSICINLLRYHNAINPDNLPEKIRNDRKIDGSLVKYSSGSRHVYEWPLNRAYRKFLSGSLKCVPSCRWGRDLLLDDVRSWDTSRLGVLERGVAAAIATQLHIQHDALRYNRFLSALSDDQVRSLKMSLPYVLRVNVFTHDRPLSFMRLWISLARALGKMRCRYCTVAVHVFQDYDLQRSSAWQEQRSLLAKGLLHGVRFVPHLQTTKLGLRQSILTSWSPRSDDEFCLFLEDDIELADLALHYTDALLRKYWYELPVPWERLLGLSLYRPLYSEVTERFVNFDQRSRLFLYEYPTSWGQVFSARPWRAFLDWEATQKGLFLLPNSFTNRWPSSSSWKKALLRWMVVTGAMLIYPNVFESCALSTNHLESGTHDKLLPNSSALNAMKTKFSVPLLPPDLNFTWSPQRLPELKSLPQYNAWSELGKVQATDVTSFDTCTVIMAVCNRVDSWKDRVLHFRNASFVSAFVVIWQNCILNRSAPSPTEVTVPFNVRIISRTNSLNNRFLPLGNVQTDCIISVDDDFDMPLANISFAVQTWRGHFWNHLVGFAGFGRNHFRTSASTWRYSTNRREIYSSIVLPTCLVYHRRYQAMYANLPTQALSYVDQKTNCDDILFNFMVSNITHSGPAVIAGTFSPVYLHEIEKIGGLWHRPDHFSVRSECVNYFVELFKGMPLRYTTTYFGMDKFYGSSREVPPGLKHYHCVDEAP